MADRPDTFFRRSWPWLFLGLATLPSIWYLLDYEDDIDPEFPRVVRQTLNTYPAPAYRFAEAGDTIDHIAVYAASAALVICGWGLVRDRTYRPLWSAALALSAAGFWHAATPGPLLDGWHGLGWRNLLDARSPTGLRLGLGAAALVILTIVARGIYQGTPRRWLAIGRRERVLRLLALSIALLVLRQVGWIDREPFGFWPRWIYVWALLAWAFALLRLAPQSPPGWPKGAAIAGLMVLWLGLDITGRGLFWYQRPLARLRAVVPDQIYLSAMPTYRGLVLANDRHHFRTIINLYPEHTLETSPHLPDEIRFAHEHGISYYGNPPDDPTGEAFVARTLEIAQDADAWPILVHCHASMDRSPAWMGLYRFLVQGWSLADAIREIERHRGLRPKSSVTLLYNRILPQLSRERWVADPTAAQLLKNARGTVDPFDRLARRGEATQAGESQSPDDAQPRR